MNYSENVWIDEQQGKGEVGFKSGTHSIIVNSGNYVDLMNPDPKTISLDDICHALARIPRFAGHTPYPYTVAHHVIIGIHMIETLRGFTAANDIEELQKLWLLHDAAEAYIGDVSRPLKALIPDIKRIEANLQKAIILSIEPKLIVDGQDTFFPIKDIDNYMLFLEKQFLFPDAENWNGESNALHNIYHVLGKNEVKFKFMKHYFQDCPEDPNELSGVLLSYFYQIFED
jgi:hypothetical protein